jgi:hypothetical protein
MEPDEERFAELLAEALAGDIARHPPAGPLERADRIGADQNVLRAGELVTPDEDDFDEDQVDDDPAPPMILEVVRRLPGALAAAGVPLAPDIAISASHFEGYGALDVLEATADRSTILALDQAGFLPEE